MPKGWGSRSDPEKQQSEDPGKDCLGGSTATEDPGLALEDRVAPQAEVLTDCPPGSAWSPPAAWGQWTPGQGAGLAVPTSVPQNVSKGSRQGRGQLRRDVPGPSGL